MKKLFFYMSIVAAMAMMVVSCSKDDDDEEGITVEKFANLLTNNSLSCTWEGLETTRRYNGGWYDDGEKYAIMRFDRASTTATEGTGFVIYFKNSFKDQLNYEGSYSEIIWHFRNNIMYVEYKRNGWPAVHAEYNTSELVINGDSFKGTWYENNDNKFEFIYKKSTFNEWDKYQ